MPPKTKTEKAQLRDGLGESARQYTEATSGAASWDSYSYRRSNLRKEARTKLTELERSYPNA